MLRPQQPPHIIFFPGADHLFVGLGGVRRETQTAQGMVGRGGQVREGVHQGAVQVKDNQVEITGHGSITF